MIFVVSGLTALKTKLNIHNKEYHRRDVHPIGYFYEKALAVQSVASHGELLHDDDNEYIVIESIREGLFPKATEEVWFFWNAEAQTFIPCEKPADVKQTCNFGLG